MENQRMANEIMSIAFGAINTEEKNKLMAIVNDLVSINNVSNEDVSKKLMELVFDSSCTVATRDRVMAFVNALVNAEEAPATKSVKITKPVEPIEEVILVTELPNNNAFMKACKPVLCFNKKGTPVVYNSGADAIRALGVEKGDDLYSAYRGNHKLAVKDTIYYVYKVEDLIKDKINKAAKSFKFPVDKYSGKIYDSLREAAKATKLTASEIQRDCTEDQERWFYLTDYIK